VWRRTRRRRHPGGGRDRAQNDKVLVGGIDARVIETPGHTAGHISYFFPADKLAFVGDTLFSIGCGRVIEGNAEMMWDSLLNCARCRTTPRSSAATNTPQPISALPRPSSPTTACSPSARRSRQLVAAKTLTIPSYMGEEKAANPFLRADVPEVAKSVGLAGKPAWQVFAEIRERKNKS